MMGIEYLHDWEWNRGDLEGIRGGESTERGGEIAAAEREEKRNGEEEAARVNKLRFPTETIPRNFLGN